MSIAYRVCNRLLNAETNLYCEYDDDVEIADDGSWRCPACGGKRWSR